MKLKKILASVLVCALATFTPLVSADASTPLPEYEVTYGDVTYHAKSEISQTGASCLTSITSSGMAYVTGTYYYLNYETLLTYDIPAANGGQHYASISFTAPTNCRSVKVRGSHTINYGAQNWEVRTEARY